MTPRTSAAAPLPAPASSSIPNTLLPVLLLLFMGSGACALIYEVVWFQLLELVVGSTAISIGVLLATYMGGMCIGSLALPKYAPRTIHPLRLYAMLELAIGVIGLLELFLIPLVGKLYSPAIGHGYLAIVVRGILAAICLLPPTILMGATLPAIARWIERSPRGVAWLGYFYGGNIVGAVIGAISAGFYLLGKHDQGFATYVAVILNIIVATIAFLIGSGPVAVANPGDVEASEPGPNPREARSVYIAIALSGACALAAEVVWTRLLSLTFGASAYTFSMILAVFLAGLGVGSSAAAWMSRVVESPRRVFAWCQFLLIPAIAWGAAVIFLALPNWPINPSLAPSAWYALQLDLARCFLVVFPAACLWGASFPFALASLSRTSEHASRLVSRVYAANTVGAICGAIICSLLLIPAFGTRDAQRALIAISAVAAAVMFLMRKEGTSVARPPMVPLLATVFVALIGITTMPQLPETLLRTAVTP